MTDAHSDLDSLSENSLSVKLIDALKDQDLSYSNTDGVKMKNAQLGRRCPPKGETDSRCATVGTYSHGGREIELVRRLFTGLQTANEGT